MSGSTPPDPGRPLVRIHYHRPPDRSEVFVQELIHDHERVKVTFAREVEMEEPLRINSEVALESGSDAVWFTFPGTWHDIGRFHRAAGTLTGIYANVLIPCTFEEEGVWRTTDLFLDVWVPTPEGRWERGPCPEAILLDEEELDLAERRGWITEELAERAREEGRRLLAAAHAGTWPPEVVAEWTRERARGGIARP